MTPIQETELDMTGLEKGTMPSLTWKIHEEKAEVRGTADEREAMRHPETPVCAAFTSFSSSSGNVHW